MLKILDKKTKLEKDLDQARSGDLMIQSCDKCGKQRISHYRKNRINRILNFYCSTCDNSENIKKVWPKIRQTNLARYGVDSFSKTKEYREKCKLTSLERYDVDNPAKSEDIKEKSKKTCLKKYGVEYTGQTENNKSKSKTTCGKRYGVEYSFQSTNNKEKSKKTWLEKYGVDNYAKTLEYKEHMKAIQDEWVENINKTKRKNGSFNISKIEDEAYELLATKFEKVLRQYNEERYPFNCDFYILEKDLFIECNFSWLHGKELFDINDKNHLTKLDLWNLKSIHKSFYKVAIETWTVRDVKKRNTAKANKLNYLEFFNLQDLKSWLEK